MSTSAAEFNLKIIDEFRGNGGRVGGVFEGTPLLLLHPAERLPQLTEYAQKADRAIPVMALTPDVR